MNVIPAAPTDNIYKFMAISGLWFIAGFILMYIWFVNIQVTLERETKQVQAYLFSVNMEDKLRARLDSLENNKLNENKLDWMPPHYKPENEKSLIKQGIENHQKTIKKYKDVLDSDTGEQLTLLKRLDVKIAIGVYIAFAVGLTWFGFSRWVKHHRKEEELKKIDEEIKIKTLNKLELELKKLKLTKHSSRLR